MSGKLVAGGPSANLPTGWAEPWGYPVNKVFIWVGEDPATQADIARLQKKVPGAKYDDLSLVGTHDRAWNAAQYVKKYGDREELVKDGKLNDPWETLPVPGGLGSWEYQSQHLPEGIDRVCAPRKWLWYDDPYMASLPAGSKNTLIRSKGGEPVHMVDKGQGAIDQYFGGRPGSAAEGVVELEWDTATYTHKVKK